MNNKSKKILKKNIENNSVFLNDGNNMDNLDFIKKLIREAGSFNKTISIIIRERDLT